MEEIQLKENMFRWMITMLEGRGGGTVGGVLVVEIQDCRMNQSELKVFVFTKPCFSRGMPIGHREITADGSLQ